jgi:RHS repeat-associated protein
VIAEHDAVTGAVNREYVWLDGALIGRVVVVNGNRVLRYDTTGQIDEPQVETKADQSLAWTGYTDPFGLGATFATPTNVLDLRLPGQWFEGEANNAGFHQNGARDYDPTLGRYVETDPLGVDAGPNVYSYVDGDPTNATDPMGLQFFNPLELTCVDPVQPGCWVGVGLGVMGLYEAGEAARALSNAQSPATPQSQTKQCPKDSPCPPCRTLSGRVVSVGTIGYRPLDVLAPNIIQHGISGPHYNIFRAQQNPNNCRCFWQPLGAVRPNDLPPEAIPIEPFAK